MPLLSAIYHLPFTIHLPTTSVNCQFPHGTPIASIPLHVKLMVMKREMTFKFGLTDTPIDSETGYFFCELSYRDINADKSIEELKSYLMTRDYQGAWKIVGSREKLPQWIYEYEKKFGDAIDESMGIFSIPLPKRPNRYH